MVCCFQTERELTKGGEIERVTRVESVSFEREGSERETS